MFANDLINPKHGDKCECPSCGMSGFLDLDTKDGCVVEEGAIWLNTKEQDWECTDCWLK